MRSVPATLGYKVSALRLNTALKVLSERRTGFWDTPLEVQATDFVESGTEATQG